ncbi:hypothetical protein [Bradyrhizobium sp. SZCCHNS3051]|uniref:hypothetical protein n=1 Tax=Bradyrhizobium sp. SZCCHNS3051 TaxID=3057320 RepID=UPI002916664B|nr:hypothetical protein [Bradyrhizobium sp. SZCCHNS3051]
MEAALPPGKCNYFFLAAFLVFFAAFLVAFAAFFAFFAMESSSGVDGLQRDFEASLAHASHASASGVDPSRFAKLCLTLSPARLRLSTARCIRRPVAPLALGA